MIRLLSINRPPRHLIPSRRSFFQYRVSLPCRRTYELPLLPDLPPTYDEIFDYPNISTPTVLELPPPDYETAIQFPPFEEPPPTYEEVLNGMRENTVVVEGLQSSTQDAPVETDRTSNPENQNGASTEFESVSFSRNGTSGSRNAGSQPNGGITNTIVAANIFNIGNRNYHSDINVIRFMNLPEPVWDFVKRVIFTSLVVGVMIYFHTAHPDWMPQWTLLVIVCLLILSLIQHLPLLYREYRDNRFGNS